MAYDVILEVSKHIDSIVEVEKFNPYHDAKGRFSTADGYASFTYAPGKSKAHDLAIAREKERTSANQGLSACKTVGDVESLIRKKDWFIHGTGDLEGWRSDDEMRLTGCDLESAKGVYEAYDAVFTRYPKLVGKLAAPVTSTAGSQMKADTYADCMMGFGSGGITLNTRHFRNAERLTKSLQANVNSGYHPKGCATPKAIVTHEIGHAIDDYLSNAVHYNGATPKNRSGYVSNNTRGKILKNAGCSTKDISREVSDYATKNAHEFWAESFSEFMCSSSPRKVATEFGAFLDGIMKEVP